MHLLRTLLWLLPPSSLKNRLLGLTPGWTVAPDARLGVNLVWRVERATIGPRARIGQFNVFRDLHRLEVASAAEIGQFNWVTGFGQYIERAADPELCGVLSLGEGAAMTSRHYVDAAGGVVLEDGVVIAGVRCVLLSHSIDPEDYVQSTAAIRLRSNAVIFTHCVLLPGADLARGVVLATNSVAGGPLDQPEHLYGGTPAKVIRSVAHQAMVHRSGRSIDRATEARLRREHRDRRSAE